MPTLRYWLQRLIPLCGLLALTACTGSSQPAPQAQPTTAPVAKATDAPKLAQTLTPALSQGAGGTTPTTAPVAKATDAPKAVPQTLAPPQPTAVAKAASPPTAAPTATEAAVAQADNMATGRLPDGEWFMGNPNAPVTVIDYSDFL